MPEQGPIARPRSRPKPPETVLQPAAPQAFPRPTEVEARMLAAVEELHATTRLLGLPPQAITIGQRNGQRLDIDPEAVSVLQRVDQALLDLDAMALGPQPTNVGRATAPVAPDEFVISGLMRPGTTMMLTGPPGAAKSWAARQLALSCGAGLRLYLDRYQITRRMRVLVVDEDNGEKEEWRREETLLASLGLRRSQVDGTVARLSLAGVMLDQPVWQAWLRGLIFDQELDLVILDPISEMHGGKELREDPNFRSLLAFLKRLKVDFPRLVTMLVHHPRKAPSRVLNAQLGLEDVRGQWGQTPDVVALMSPLGERRVQWEVHKRVPYSKLVLLASESGPLEVVADESTAPEKRVSRDNRVLSAIEAGASDWEQVHHATGMSRSSIFNAVKALRRAKLLTPHEPYELVFDPTEDAIE